jgi:hypothetical protein
VGDIAELVRTPKHGLPLRFVQSKKIKKAYHLSSSSSQKPSIGLVLHNISVKKKTRI